MKQRQWDEQVELKGGGVLAIHRAARYGPEFREFGLFNPSRPLRGIWVQRQRSR